MSETLSRCRPITDGPAPLYVAAFVRESVLDQRGRTAAAGAEKWASPLPMAPPFSPAPLPEKVEPLTLRLPWPVRPLSIAPPSKKEGAIARERQRR